MDSNGQSLKSNILLVEDNNNNAGAVLKLLEESGAALNVQRCFNLEEAASQLRPGISIILLDLDLPDSKGIETLKEVQNLAPGIPVVVFTEQDDEDLAVEAVKLGAQDYLVKGEITKKRLVSCLKYSIHRNHTALRFKEEFRQKADQILDPTCCREFKHNMDWLEQHIGKQGA